MERRKINLPPCGMFIGSGIYPMSKDYLLCTLYAHQGWAPQSYSPLEMIEKIIEDNQGNLAQLWGHSRGSSPATVARWFYALDEIGIDVPEPDWENCRYLKPEDCEILKKYSGRRGAGFIRFIKAAAEKGIYTLLIYANSEPQWSERFKESGDYYLGYDYGENFTPGLDNKVITGKKNEKFNLKTLADGLVEQVRTHVEERHKTGWGNVMATSGNFYVDYEILAGTDVPVIEDFAFKHLNVASGLSRGLYRQYNLPLWGSHLAHEHYSWVPQRYKHKFDLLKTAMYQKYMAGCKMIINESGNWFVEASLCEDSPRFKFPRVNIEHSLIRKEPCLYAPFIKEARKHYRENNYHSRISRKYRKVISDFYNFVKNNGTPEGQPETTIAVVKGNYDLCGENFNPNSAIAGLYSVAEKNPLWFEGTPERGWDIVKYVFYPLPPVLKPYHNLFLSGTPYGMVDIVSFARDNVSAEFLNANYKALLFSGWNTSSEKQYETLKQYVANGGKLFISIPHFSTNKDRNYISYTVKELVKSGDLSELCGVRVNGCGKRFYWATAPYDSIGPGFNFPRRFGVMMARMGNIEITGSEVKTLVVDDEEGSPILLRHTLGKGEVFFLNTWDYPGGLNRDEGPGGFINSKGLIGTIYRYIAQLSRGSVWITDNQQEPGAECEYINYSYFPGTDTICLLNIDFKRKHRFFLHHFGIVDRIEISPSEFRTLKTIRNN